MKTSIFSYKLLDRLPRTKLGIWFVATFFFLQITLQGQISCSSGFQHWRCCRIVWHRPLGDSEITPYLWWFFCVSLERSPHQCWSYKLLFFSLHGSFLLIWKTEIRFTSGLEEYESSKGWLFQVYYKNSKIGIKEKGNGWMI